jgi:hypothetical protein
MPRPARICRLPHPEDGATGDGLLNAADAAMYAEKKEKKPSY